MNKIRLIVYFLCFAVLVFFVKARQEVVTSERQQDVVSLFSQWQANGKPVVVKKLEKQDVPLLTKITARHVSGNKYQSYVPKYIQKKLRPGQIFFIKGQHKDIEGIVTGVADTIDLSSGMFPVSLTLKQSLTTFDDWIIVYVRVDTVSDVICIPAELLDKQEDTYQVWVLRDGKARRVRVTLGQRNGFGAIIDKGLQPGDVLIVKGTTHLKEGDKLNILREGSKEN